MSSPGGQGGGSAGIESDRNNIPTGAGNDEKLENQKIGKSESQPPGKESVVGSEITTKPSVKPQLLQEETLPPVKMDIVGEPGHSKGEDEVVPLSTEVQMARNYVRDKIIYLLAVDPKFSGLMSADDMLLKGYSYIPNHKKMLVKELFLDKLCELHRLFSSKDGFFRSDYTKKYRNDVADKDSSLKARYRYCVQEYKEETLQNLVRKETESVLLRLRDCQQQPLLLFVLSLMMGNGKVGYHVPQATDLQRPRPIKLSTGFIAVIDKLRDMSPFKVTHLKLDSFDLRGNRLFSKLLALLSSEDLNTLHCMVQGREDLIPVVTFASSVKNLTLQGTKNGTLSEVDFFEVLTGVQKEDAKQLKEKLKIAKWISKHKPSANQVLPGIERVRLLELMGSSQNKVLLNWAFLCPSIKEANSNFKPVQWEELEKTLSEFHLCELLLEGNDFLPFMEGKYLQRFPKLERIHLKGSQLVPRDTFENGNDSYRQLLNSVKDFIDKITFEETRILAMDQQNMGALMDCYRDMRLIPLTQLSFKFTHTLVVSTVWTLMNFFHKNLESFSLEVTTCVTHVDDFEFCRDFPLLTEFAMILNCPSSKEIISTAVKFLGKTTLLTTLEVQLKAEDFYYLEESLRDCNLPNLRYLKVCLLPEPHDLKNPELQKGLPFLKILTRFSHLVEVTIINNNAWLSNQIQDFQSDMRIIAAPYKFTS